MGFWSGLGELILVVTDVITGTANIKEWIEMSDNDADKAIKYFVDTGSKNDIELVHSGFVLSCTISNSDEEIKKLLTLFSYFVKYREPHNYRLK